MHKPCQPSVKKRRRLKSGTSPDGRTRHTSASGSTSGLERKLDELVSLLKPASSTSPDGDFGGVQRQPEQYQQGGSYEREQRNEPSAQEAEECLATFRDCHAMFLPIFSLSPTITAAQLRLVRPLLWESVMTLGCSSTATQNSRSIHLRQRLAHEALVKSELSLDLLLSLIAFVAWVHLHMHPIHQKAFLTTSTCTFSGLAIAVVHHLRLHQPIASEPSQIWCVSQAYGSEQCATRTTEERRAVLGCFLLTSTISSTIKVIDSLRWTAHMEDCLVDLENRREYPQDQLLVQQVRLQLAAERAIVVRWYDQSMLRNVSHTPPHLYAQALLCHLEEVRSSAPLELQQNSLLQLQGYAAQIAINEVGLSGDPSLKDPNVGLALPNLTRVKQLYASLQAIRSWLEVFFSLPLNIVRGIPTSIILQMRHCMGMLFVLSSLDDPSWNTADVRASLDILVVIDRVSERFRSIAQAGGIDANGEAQGHDVWTNSAERIQTLRSVWADKLRAQQTAIPQNSYASLTPATSVNDAIFSNWDDLDFTNFDWVNSTF
ncbi:hypothetical protein LTR56_012044 [Elasticomyces elasticus]|nr:hypothetical protein LTR56_012044 [Elasticomyces elasticus]KAK3651794.1 hypothetical protein LTR22_011963 [Elasticomyces elasticus]KAK4930152.1 hypothetical protein LTR49_003185 [Elasticomyces elasticus]KAK5752489.1 hypothetical protein LTS12_017426 [Elasticomyces elasticus]